MTWLIDTLIVTGALIAAVLVLRRPVARLFGPGLAYALWLLPLARLIVPPLVLPARPVETAASAAQVIEVPVGAAAAPAPAFDPLPWLLGFWLAGSALFLAWRLGSYFAMRRRILAVARPVGDAGAVRMVESEQVAVPMAFGLIDKVVALPAGFMDQADVQGRDLAIAHELEHHAGRDIAVNFAMQPLLALHWFNPLAWAAWRALRRDQEAACDARVVAGRDGAAREAYGRLIARFAAGSHSSLAPALACPVVLGEKSIIYRLRSLTMTQHSPRRRMTGRLLIGAAALALPLTATISYAASDDPAPTEATEKAEVHKEHKIVIVEKHGPDSDDSKLKTKVVTRDGKTVVIKTDKDLTDAEVEERVAKAMAMVPPTPDMPPMPEGAERSERRVMVMRTAKNDEAPNILTIDTQTVDGACADEEPVKVDEEGSADGKRKVLKIKVCSRHPARGQVAAALREARNEVADDKDIPADVRAKVLKNLDEQIEKLTKQG